MADQQGPRLSDAGLPRQRRLTLFSGEATPRRSCRAVQHRPAPPGPFPPGPARRQPSGLACSAGSRCRRPQARPRLTVTTVASGLTIPWDVTWVGDVMLFNERGGRVLSKRAGSAARWSAPADRSVRLGRRRADGHGRRPRCCNNHRFYVCYASRGSGIQRDVRVVRWRLTSDTTAVLDGANAVVVSGLPIISSGRHSGCRLRFRPDGRLFVGTGDAATGSNPQDLQSLGGKVLRLNSDGSIPTDNPFHHRMTTPGTYSATVTATCRGWRSGRGRRSCGAPSTERSETTRST